MGGGKVIPFDFNLLKGNKLASLAKSECVMRLEMQTLGPHTHTHTTHGRRGKSDFLNIRPQQQQQHNTIDNRLNFEIVEYIKQSAEKVVINNKTRQGLQGGRVGGLHNRW